MLALRAENQVDEEDVEREPELSLSNVVHDGVQRIRMKPVEEEQHLPVNPIQFR
jgi:hypothetical protein